MERSGVTVRELAAYCKERSFIPQEGNLADVKKGIQKQMVEDANWEKVVEKIKASRE